ncbi:MAG: cell division protein FtsQ/DivIB [Thermoleophilaceae bacterium]|jgi:cell division protein FtsQ
MLSALPPRLRLAVVLSTLLAALLAAGYLLWLRDSPLVAVENTTVTGLTTGDAGEIRTELRRAAEGMTTLNVDAEALERAVASYPAVAGIDTSVDLPHGLEVEVAERRPVAMVEAADGTAVPAAADGTLLPDFAADGSLPRLPGEAPEGGTVTGDATLDGLAAVDAAPANLARRVEVVEPRGGRLVAVLEDGPLVVLGDSSRADAKWIAAAAVLAQGDAAGAGYVDVSLPERPAVGG